MSSAPFKPASAGHWLRDLRRRQRLSQMDLALQVGLSQRHLSCVETGKANPSRELLLALLDGLDAPLGERNEVMLAAGYAPVYSQKPLHHDDMDVINRVIDSMLATQGSTPVMVLDSAWNLLRFNPGFVALVRGLGFDPAMLNGQANLLTLMLAPGGLAERIVNRGEVLGEVLYRAQREAVHAPALRQLLAQLDLPDSRKREPRLSAPVLIMRLTSQSGELRFLSTFTTFGTPMDITTASLRIEHLFPADEATAAVMQKWLQATL